MQQRAEGFKNGGLDQQDLDESSFVDTAERRDKVSMVFGDEPQPMEDQTERPLKNRKRKGGAKASGLRVRANSNAANLNNTNAAHLSNAVNDP